MSRTDPQFNLRIPQELRDRVMEAAQANKRSATAEILARLEESFAPGVNPDAPLAVVRHEGGDLPTSSITHLPSPNELMRQIGMMADSLREMAAELKELRGAKEKP